ncbi:uncharacterized protein BP5553_04701 [Venustampulla echinocandica]|uniref:Uncharacterized protein n=1 Tax=Venustampulla echinocandica TaxID=2656787 RepID=A0A370TP30_9HELO|nr:uncharacterized protein BP5553_04701 [Venustampulla echinocandica]RDL37268.1 hypothetical protein BP5553_04701 [Venustampulla echinocandica]
MTLILTRIEIDAPPAVVRAKFLDFENLLNYSPDGFIKSIGPKVEGEALIEGTKMRCVLKGATMEPVCLENSPSAFSWRGALPLGLFTGDHGFRFSPGVSGPETTIFIHEEQFSGLLAFMIGDNWFARSVGLRRKTEAGFKGFNVDLKSVCEQWKQEGV